MCILYTSTIRGMASGIEPPTEAGYFQFVDGKLEFNPCTEAMITGGNPLKIFSRNAGITKDMTYEQKYDLCTEGEPITYESIESADDMRVSSGGELLKEYLTVSYRQHVKNNVSVDDCEIYLYLMYKFITIFASKNERNFNPQEKEMFGDITNKIFKDDEQFQTFKARMSELDKKYAVVKARSSRDEQIIAAVKSTLNKVLVETIKYEMDSTVVLYGGNSVPVQSGGGKFFQTRSGLESQKASLKFEQSMKVKSGEHQRSVGLLTMKRLLEIVKEKKHKIECIPIPKNYTEMKDWLVKLFGAELLQYTIPGYKKVMDRYNEIIKGINEAIKQKEKEMDTPVMESTLETIPELVSEPESEPTTSSSVPRPPLRRTGSSGSSVSRLVVSAAILFAAAAAAVLEPTAGAAVAPIPRRSSGPEIGSIPAHASPSSAAILAVTDSAPIMTLSNEQIVGGLIQYAIEHNENTDLVLTKAAAVQAAARKGVITTKKIDVQIPQELQPVIATITIGNPLFFNNLREHTIARSDDDFYNAGVYVPAPKARRDPETKPMVITRRPTRTPLPEPAYVVPDSKIVEFNNDITKRLPSIIASLSLKTLQDEEANILKGTGGFFGGAAISYDSLTPDEKHIVDTTIKSSLVKKEIDKLVKRYIDAMKERYNKEETLAYAEDSAAADAELKEAQRHADVVAYQITTDDYKKFETANNELEQIKKQTEATVKADKIGDELKPESEELAELLKEIVNEEFVPASLDEIEKEVPTIKKVVSRVEQKTMTAGLVDALYNILGGSEAKTLTITKAIRIDFERKRPGQEPLLNHAFFTLSNNLHIQALRPLLNSFIKKALYKIFPKFSTLAIDTWVDNMSYDFSVYDLLLLAIDTKQIPAVIGKFLTSQKTITVHNVQQSIREEMIYKLELIETKNSWKIPFATLAKSSTISAIGAPAPILSIGAPASESSTEIEYAELTRDKTLVATARHILKNMEFDDSFLTEKDALKAVAEHNDNIKAVNTDGLLLETISTIGGQAVNITTSITGAFAEIASFLPSVTTIVGETLKDKIGLATILAGALIGGVKVSTINIGVTGGCLNWIPCLAPLLATVRLGSQVAGFALGTIPGAIAGLAASSTLRQIPPAMLSDQKQIDAANAVLAIVAAISTILMIWGDNRNRRAAVAAPAPPPAPAGSGAPEPAPGGVPAAGLGLPAPGGVPAAGLGLPAPPPAAEAPPGGAGSGAPQPPAAQPLGEAGGPPAGTGAVAAPVAERPRGLGLLGPPVTKPPITTTSARRRAASADRSGGAGGPAPGSGQGGGYRMTGKNKRKTGKGQRKSRKRISRRKHRKV
jgi:hypothetical protein